MIPPKIPKNIERMPSTGMNRMNPIILGSTMKMDHGVDLFGDTHGADLRRNIAADLTGQDQTHHGGREFQNQNLAGGQSCGVCGNQRRYNIDGHLNAYHGTDEYGNDDDQGNGVHTQLIYLLDQAFEKLPPFVGNAEYLRQKEAVFPKSLY